MGSNKTKDFWIAVGIRAGKTFFQSIVASMTGVIAITEMNIGHALIVAGTAALLSVFTSLATGLPEVGKDEEKE